MKNTSTPGVFNSALWCEINQDELYSDPAHHTSLVVSAVHLHRTAGQELLQVFVDGLFSFAFQPFSVQCILYSSQ